MSTDIDTGFWIQPNDHEPEQLIAVDTERVEPKTAQTVRELLVFSCGYWYTVGLKRRIGPRDSVKRWRSIV